MPRENRNQCRAVLSGVRAQKGKQPIAIVWLYRVSEVRVTRSITLEPQLPIEKINAQALLLGRESYSLLMRGHQRKKIERQIRHVTHILQFKSQISGEDYSERAISHNVDQVVVTDPNLVVAQSYVTQLVS